VVYDEKDHSGAALEQKQGASERPGRRYGGSSGSGRGGFWKYPEGRWEWTVGERGTRRNLILPEFPVWG